MMPTSSTFTPGLRLQRTDTGDPMTEHRSESGTQFVGVDWSGAGPATAQKTAIWTAVVREGVVEDLTSGRTRAETVDHLVALASKSPRTVVGLDFAFSLPRWWLAERGFDSTETLWRWAATRAADDPDGWLKALPEPFWGVYFRLKPAGAFGALRPEFRRTELELTAPGARPMSTFRLFGPGTVGAQGLRGHPCLLKLRESSFTIWPFEPVGPQLVVEVFPRLLVRQLSPGLSHLNGNALRAAFLDAAPPGLTGDGAAYADLLRGNQDAFDAAVSAWALWYGREALSDLASQKLHDDYALEGSIWRLPDGCVPPVAASAQSAPPSGQDGGVSRVAAIRRSFAAGGHHLIVARPALGGPHFVFWVPFAAAGEVAPYTVGESAVEAAERALKSWEGSANQAPQPARDTA